MILEQLIFTILAFGIFVYMFFKMIRENDTNYIGVLIIEAIGISLNFIEVLKKIQLGIINNYRCCKKSICKKYKCGITILYILKIRQKRST